MITGKKVKSQYFIVLVILQLLRLSNCTSDVNNIVSQQNTNPLCKDLKTDFGKTDKIERRVKTKIDLLNRPS